MSVWFVTPSKRPPHEVEPLIRLWLSKGYHVLLQRDPGDPPLNVNLGSGCFRIMERPYQGHSEAVNYLCRTVLSYDLSATWMVNAADDIEPDPTHSAEQIGLECTAHFGGTFGVMQPIGDNWAGSRPDLICGSPWLGREFCRRMYRGQGPMWPGYFHMFDDEELLNVSKRLGVLWQRRDLIHKHNHWTRTKQPKPAFLEYAAGQKNWDKMSAIFRERKKHGFPGHEPLPPEPR